MNESAQKAVLCGSRSDGNPSFVSRRFVRCASLRKHRALLFLHHHVSSALNKHTRRDAHATTRPTGAQCASKLLVRSAKCATKSSSSLPAKVRSSCEPGIALPTLAVHLSRQESRLVFRSAPQPSLAARVELFAAVLRTPDRTAALLYTPPINFR